MSEAAYLFLGTALTVAVTAFVTIWGQRRRSPGTASTLLGGADMLLTQLQTRLISLEARVATLERENDAYHRLYGPLPLTNTK